MAGPAAILLVFAFSAQGQAQPGKLRPAIALPTPTPQPAPRAPAAVQARPTPNSARPVPVARTSNAVCQIRAGTFSQRANADNLAKALKPLGEVRVRAMRLGGKPVHLVTIVGLRTRKNAELALDRLKTSGQDLGALSISGCRT